MTNQPTPTPVRRKRQQAMSDEGRQLLQRERQRIAREQAVLGERLAAEARRNEGRQEYNAIKVNDEEAAVQRGIVKRIAAVLASEGVSARLDVASAGSMIAWTDFDRIHVRYRQHEDKRLVAAVLRGLMYHEAGHCRFTDPYIDLQGMISDPANIPGLVPPLTEEGIQPAIPWRRFHKPWNALEDQRMETAVTIDSPVKALYLTPMMMTELMETPEKAVANWPLMIWRRYLPCKLRAAARRGFVKLHGEALAQSFEAVVDSYVRATDADTMMAAVVEMAELLDIANITLSIDDFGHDRQGRRRNKRDQVEGEEKTPTQIPTIPSFEEDEDEDDEEDEQPSNEGGTPMPQSADDDEDEAEDDEAEDGSQGGDDEGSDEGDDDAPQGKSESNDGGDTSDGNSSADHSKDSKDEDEDDLTQDDIDEAKADAEAERDADHALDDDVEAYHNAKEDRVSDLSPYVGGLDTDDVAGWEAEALAAEIERSFQMATMDRQPAWVEQQHRGIINVGRYEVARQAPDGGSDFYRDWVEDDQPGFNLAVSLMLDYSSSMCNYTKQLAQVGYAVKLACQKLDIPCTVTLWDTDATVLYDATERAEGLPKVVTAGATDPSPALADLENQRFDKANHLVLIMTDGEWQGNWSGRAGMWGNGRKRAQGDQSTLAFHANDRMIVGFGFATYQPTADRYAENLRGYGCPEAFGITNLMEIPERLQEMLIALA